MDRQKLIQRRTDRLSNKLMRLTDMERALIGLFRQTHNRYYAMRVHSLRKKIVETRTQLTHMLRL